MLNKYIQRFILYLVLSFLILFSAMADSNQFNIFQKDFGLKPNSHVEMQSFIEKITKQLEKEPFKAELYYYLARAYASQGWEDKASQYFSQWIKLSNNNIVLKDNNAFLLDEKNDKVLIVDTKTKQIVKKIDMPWLPIKMTSSPKDAKIYVTSSLADSVSVLDIDGMSVEDTIKTGSMPWDIKTSPKGDRAYVANLKSDDVSVIDTSKNAVLDKVKVGQGPWNITVSPDGRRLYVSNQDSRDLRVIDTGNYSVVDVLSIGSNPRDMAIAPDDKNKLYIADTNVANDELEIYVVNLEELGISDSMNVPFIDDPLLVKFQKMSLTDKINAIGKYTKPIDSNPKQTPIPKSDAMAKLDFGNRTNESKNQSSVANKPSLASQNPIELPAKSKEEKRNVMRVIVVVKSDTLWKISVDNYGMATAAIYKAIQELNPGLDDINVVYAGQKIMLPELNQTYPAVATTIAKAQTGSKSIIVKSNDNLFRIVLTNYGNATEDIYAEVLKANPHIESKDRILIGQRIRLPDIPNNRPESNFEHIASISNY